MTNIQKIHGQYIKDIVNFYIKDKVKLIKFLIKEDYMKKDIAKVLGITASAISHILTRSKGVEHE